MLTNFPNGVSSFGMPVLPGLAVPQLTTTGNVWWVNSNGPNGFGNDPQQAFTTLAAAVAAAAAGDLIMVMGGHAEAISSATALTLSKAGLKVVGLGSGTRRPTFTLDTAATATINVTAASAVFFNCIFTANFADIASLFTLTTAKDFQVLNCYVKATAANMNFLALVDTSTTNNAADGLTIAGCTWIEPDTATKQMVIGDADIDRLTVVGNVANLGVNSSDLPIVVAMATGKDLTNLLISGNQFVRLNDANPLLATMDTTTANSGVVSNNFVRHADTSGELLVTVGSPIGFFQNFCTAADDVSGYLLPAADS